MEFFERISGARMHTALYKPNDIDYSALTNIFFLDLSKFLIKSSRVISGSFLSLLVNRVLKTRLVNVGSISLQKILNYGISGVISRSSGLFDDLRFNKNDAYGAY
jgi:NADH:ubiquinone oxidoreductase subunit D